MAFWGPFWGPCHASLSFLRPGSIAQGKHKPTSELILNRILACLLGSQATEFPRTRKVYTFYTTGWQDSKKNARKDYTFTTGTCFLKDGRQDFSTAEEIILLGAWVLALLGLFVWRFRLHAECLWSSVEDEGGEATAALL